MKNYKKINWRAIIQIVAFLPITIILLTKFKYFSISLLLLTAFAGAFYCGYLCPFGFIQELLIVLRKKLKIKSRVIPKKLDFSLKILRYVLYLSISILSINSLKIFLKYDARSNLYLILTGKHISIVMIVSIFIFALVALYFDKPFCRYLCIKGASYGLASIFRLFSIKRDIDSCINCKLCDKVCNMGISVSTVNSVNSPSCINCLKCVEKCPKKGTLKFGLIEKKLLKQKLLLIIIAAIVYIFFAFLTSTKNIEESGVKIKESKVKNNNLDYRYGEAEGYNGLIHVKVGMENGKIIEIKVVEHNEDEDWYDSAKPIIFKSIIGNQSVDVEGVAGATYTSNGLKNAVKNAINNFN